MIKPDYLKQGDTIGIVATARKISENELSASIIFLKNQGFNILLGKHLFNREHQFAGTDSERATDFQFMLNHPEIKAILCARGGYGSVRIIDQLNFSNFIQKPKWVCGYSDITVFHSHLHRQFHTATLHSTMPINMKEGEFSSETNLSLIKALCGKEISYQLSSHPLNRPGKATGELVGGNLSILYSLLGSSSDINTDGKILFIEDLDEYLYHIDRMMMNLKRNGKLKNLSGLIVGGMSEMNDNTVPYGKNAEEIIAEHCAEYDFPLYFNFPAGHLSQNYALRLGTLTQLNYTNLIQHP
ncbi:MAG: LD-carboxypeptidase [Bacteroidales bacterium]